MTVKDRPLSDLEITGQELVRAIRRHRKAKVCTLEMIADFAHAFGVTPVIELPSSRRKSDDEMPF